jgi:membrane protease YdiL (CAAX protease family)
MKNMNNLWVYLAVVFILSFFWQLIIYFNGGIDSPLIPITMLFPAIVAIAFRIINKEGFRNVGWGLRKWWYIFPSVMAPVLIILVIGWLFTTLNWATLSDKHFLFREGMVEIQKIPFVLGNHSQSVAFFALNLVLSLFVQSLLGGIVTMGEEFGWRAYVQEKLIRKYGLNGGLILLGVIWGYWHLPIGLMGWNFPEHPVLGALILTPLSMIFLGIFLGWLYLRSKSIWMPALAHAAINLTATLLFSELNIQKGDLCLQLMFIACWGVVAGLCLLSLNRKKPLAGLP